MLARRTFLSALLFALCASASAAAEPVTIGELQRIRSAVLDEDREYQVHLPGSYKWAKDRRYPVLYVLDGKAHFVHTVGATDFLASTGEIPEVIVVAIASTVRVRDFTQTDWPKRWVGGGGADNFKRFLSTELIPAIERTYRTNGFRILSGHSAGGQFALYALTSEPALFRAYFAFSSSLNWDDNLPLRSLKKALDSTQAPPAFLYVSREDASAGALADYNTLVEILGSTTRQGFRWKSQAFPDETHTSVPLLSQIHALRALYAGYRLPEGLPDKGLSAVEKHYESVSRTLGWPIAVPEEAINTLAYDALARERVDEAIALFKRNVDASPNSANAWDSLADGYAKAGRFREAASASDRSVDLATQFENPNASYFQGQAKKMNDRLLRESGAPR